VPPSAEIERLGDAIESSGVRLVALNLFAGNMAAGERGIRSLADRSQELRENVEIVVGLGARLGCRTFNALYGNRSGAATPTAQDDVAAENLAFAARAVAEIGGVVVLEPLSGVELYPLRLAQDAVDRIERVERDAGVTNLALLADLYHLATNGDDLSGVIARHHDRIAHVQVADVPGRHEPGTGRLPLAGHLGELAELGYQGWISLEYEPSGTSADSFDWLPREQRGSAERLDETRGERR
jgi:hydroxypyruvate isomerase